MSPQIIISYAEHSVKRDLGTISLDRLYSEAKFNNTFNNAIAKNKYNDIRAFLRYIQVINVPMLIFMALDGLLNNSEMS